MVRERPFPSEHVSRHLWKRKGTLNWGPYLRYDLYKQIGAPKVETSDDYLDILKKMQEIYPENENKQKVYGFSLGRTGITEEWQLGDLLGNINGFLMISAETFWN